MKKEKKNSRMEIRISKAAKSRIVALARIYADGNVSRWIEYAALAAERKFLK